MEHSPPFEREDSGPGGAAMTTTAENNRAALHNSIALLLSRVMVAAMGWAGSIVIARLLSPDDWGKFSFIFGLLGLLSIITDLGVGPVVLARLMDDDEREVASVAGSYVALRLALGVLGYLAAVGYVLALGYPTSVVRATAVAGVVVVLATPSHALSVLFQSRLRLTVVAVAEATGQAVQLTLTVLAAVFAPVLLAFILPFIANEVVKIWLKLRSVRRGSVGPVPSRTAGISRWRGMLIEAIPLTIGTALVTLLSKVDILMLSRLDTFDSVGLYSVGYKFSDALELISFAVATPVLTLLVRAWSTDSEEFRRRSRETTLVLALLASVAITGFWASAEPLLTILYGPRFGVSAFSSRLLVAGSGLSMISYVGFTVLVAAGRGRLYPVVGIIGLTLNVALNFVLIPRMSYNGAAIATVISESIVLVVMWVLLTRAVPVDRLFPLAQLLGMAIATGAIVAASTLVEGVVPWPFLAAACVAASLMAAWVLKVPAIRAVPSFAHTTLLNRRKAN